MHPVISLICLRLRRVQVLVSVFCVVHYDLLVAARPQQKARHDAVGQDQVQGDRKALKGQTLHQIAADLGFSRRTILRWLQKW